MKGARKKLREGAVIVIHKNPSEGPKEQEKSFKA